MHTPFPDLANGWADCVQIWFVARDPFDRALQKSEVGRICTCARAHLIHTMVPPRPLVHRRSRRHTGCSVFIHVFPPEFADVLVLGVLEWCSYLQVEGYSCSEVISRQYDRYVACSMQFHQPSPPTRPVSPDEPMIQSHKQRPRTRSQQPSPQAGSLQLDSRADGLKRPKSGLGISS